MKYNVIDKETGEIVYLPIDKLIGNEDKYIFLEIEFTRSLSDIWNQFEQPFIAENSAGYFVIIEKNVNEQKEKYNRNVYGKIDKSIINLFRKTKTQPIYDIPEWKFIALYN